MKADNHLTRRAFLTGTGATLILAAGGMVWRAESGVFTAEEGPAYELWKQQWPPTEKGPESLVAAAVLAANPHNSQPWLFRVQEDRIFLYADRSRKLEAIDPDERELMLGLGCALENLALAADAHGYETDTALLPEGPQSDLVAEAGLRPAEPAPSSFYHMIPRRRTNRARYSGKPIPGNDLADLAKLAEADPGLQLHLFVEEKARGPVGDLIVRACEIQANDSAQHAETASWFRKSEEEIARHGDGITIDAGGSPYLMRVLAKLVISDKMIQGPSFGKAFVKSTQRQVASASAFAVISGEDKTPASCLRAGRLYQRIHLWATGRGIALHPMNYPLENRPELREEVVSVFGATGHEALIPFRLGYGPAVPHSPRRALDDVMVG
ncbi:MAG: nitroreductase family protein [Candidatus Abyssubacteria bacterium]